MIALAAMIGGAVGALLRWCVDKADSFWRSVVVAIVGAFILGLATGFMLGDRDSLTQALPIAALLSASLLTFSLVTPAALTTMRRPQLLPVLRASGLGVLGIACGAAGIVLGLPAG